MGDNDNGNGTLSLLNLKQPQDPLFPEQKLSGPSFLDTEACLCALQETPDPKGKDAVWQCAANQKSVYKTRLGKWFPAKSGGDKIDLPVNDGSNPPDAGKALVWNSSNRSFEPLKDAAKLEGNDKYCTGTNQSTLSTAFYQAHSQIMAGKKPVAATPCWRPGGVPIQIVSAQQWQDKGCSEGFHCANNTVNSLPQFCPPVTECQQARLAGDVCQFDGLNIGMGSFEPVACQAGYYCPTSSKGRESIRCPSGSYCQPGAATPTPCAIGSKCSAGASYELFLIPLGILIALDILLVVGMFFEGLRSRVHNGAKSHISALGSKKKSGMSVVTATITGYKQLHDETDHEMAEMDATYMPGHDGWNGFQSVLEMHSATTGYNQEGPTKDLAPQLQKFVDSMRKATDATNFGLSFGYKGLSFQPRGSSRPVLQNITGSIERGSLVAVMGGSGAGKSTFVNVLMGKTANTGGSITVNGTPGKINRYKKLIGYVPQDDIVLPELTVYENIVHSAKVRLPRTWSTADIESHVDSVIDCLELSHVRDSLVGSISSPVISGGQRKRVSIGMELAAGPMAIFLDEPTSGLDATAAASIMRTLQALAKLGISVIVIIHQPRVEIFEMLDNLILLGNGQMIYEGPQSGAHKYFEAAGFNFPENNNQGDVITDIITGHGRLYKRIGDISKEALIANWSSGLDKTSVPYESTSSSDAGNNRSMSRFLRKGGASYIKQLWLCLSRGMLQQYRAKGAFWSEMILATIAGFLIGLAEASKKGVLFKGLYNAPNEVLSLSADFQSAPELALLIVIAIGLVSAAPGVKVFSEELMLQRRETEAGHSRIAYFIAKILSVLPRMAFACFHFTVPLMLLAVPIIPWGIAFLTNLLYFYCIYGLASCMSMIVRREDAPLFATIISLIVGILSGAAPPLSKVQSWHMEWLWRASPGTWLAELYFGQLVEPFRYLYKVDLAADATGFYLDWTWLNIGVLLGIGTIYRVLAFFGLVFGYRMRR